MIQLVHWLVLCVNLAGSWFPDICLNLIQDISVRVLWRKLTLKSVDLKTGLHNVGGLPINRRPD